jgi:hypothetical protein
MADFAVRERCRRADVRQVTALNRGQYADSLQLTDILCQIGVGKPELLTHALQDLVFLFRNAGICNRILESTPVKRKCYHAGFGFTQIPLLAYTGQLARLGIRQNAILQGALEVLLVQRSAPQPAAAQVDQASAGGYDQRHRPHPDLQYHVMML